MATNAKKTGAVGKWGWRRDSLTIAQFLKMAEHGILADASYELRDGVLYRMSKGELHNLIVLLAARALQRALPEGVYLRQECSTKDGERSLPEPDLAVARGGLFDSFPLPPPLERITLIVEVSHHTYTEDRGIKLRRYASAGVPVYWIVRATRRIVSVFGEPQGSGARARYATQRDYKPGEDFPIVIDGVEVGRIAVSDLFPPEAAKP